MSFSAEPFSIFLFKNNTHISQKKVHDLFFFFTLTRRYISKVGN